MVNVKLNTWHFRLIFKCIKYYTKQYTFKSEFQMSSDEKPKVKFVEIIAGGRLTIPNEQRTQMDLKEGDPVKIWVSDGQIHIEKAVV